MRTLLEVAALKRLAEALRVQSISAKAAKLVIRLRRDARVDVDRLIELVSTRPGASFSPTGVLTLAVGGGAALVATGARDARRAGLLMPGERHRPHGLAAAAAVALAWATLSAAACRREPPPSPDAVARIDGQEVRYGRFAAYLTRAVGDGDEGLGSDALSALFDQFVDEQLLARLAADRGLAAAAGGPRQAVAALLADRGSGAAPAEPSAAEVAAYYAAHRGDFVRPERVRLRQILAEDRATAERAAREIAAGADFQAVARRLSAASRGGSVGGGPAAAGGSVGDDLGELSRADLPPAYADTLFSLKPGAVSRIIPADYGFHIFQVVDHLPPETLPLADVAEEIRDRLERESADRRLAALVASCRKRYNVEVYARNLPFDYEGTYRDTKTRSHR